MQAALRLSALVQPGGRVEVTDTQLPAGKPVDVIILLPPAEVEPRHSIMDVLADAPGHLAFQTADEIDAYLLDGSFISANPIPAILIPFLSWMKAWSLFWRRMWKRACW